MSTRSPQSFVGRVKQRAMSEAWQDSFASNPAVREKMSRQRRQDTAPEQALRHELHRMGMRYYVHRRPLAMLRRQADIIFPRARVAVFVDGCFWHACPDHGTVPKVNRWYWAEKIGRNRVRDVDTDRHLVEAGWTSVRVWEHEPPIEAARRIERIVSQRRPASGQETTHPGCILSPPDSQAIAVSEKRERKT